MNKKMTLALGFVIVLTGCASGAVNDKGVLHSQIKHCEPINEAEVAKLFERWNDSLQTGDPAEVVKNYAKHSILLPTLSGASRLTQAEKEDYFLHFLAQKPAGTVTARQISIGCNMAVDSGSYTFYLGSSGTEVPARYTYTYKWENGQWLIVSHHSSLVPEK